MEGGPEDGLEGHGRDGFGEAFEGYEEFDARDDVDRLRPPLEPAAQDRRGLSIHLQR